MTGIAAILQFRQLARQIPITIMGKPPGLLLRQPTRELFYMFHCDGCRDGSAGRDPISCRTFT